MNYLEEKNGDFSIISKIPIINEVTSFLLLKNGNILTSLGKKYDFNIQEWTPNENYYNSKLYNDDFISNKNINEADINVDTNNLGRATTFEPCRNMHNFFQINTNNHLYEKTNSFLSNHKDDINVMIEMDNSMFATGGNDKAIIIWKKDEESKNYKNYQTISKGIKMLKSGIKHMIFLYDKRIVSSDSYSILIWHIEKNVISNPNNYYSLQQKINYYNGNITVLYQIREGSIVSGNNKSYFEIWNEINGKYKSVKSINLKINSITCINQLKNGRIIIASQQGIIKIIEIDGSEESSETITTIQGLPIQCIECFEDGSFILCQNTTLQVWKNNESI